MSASLVGSEMCIRDRLVVVVVLVVLAAVMAVPVVVLVVFAALVDRCSDAVSYTHLTLPTICSV
eukprot:2399961-Alexandrium_andersonii.AAC.1